MLDFQAKDVVDPIVSRVKNALVEIAAKAIKDQMPKANFLPIPMMWMQRDPSAPPFDPRTCTSLLTRNGSDSHCNAHVLPCVVQCYLQKLGTGKPASFVISRTFGLADTLVSF